MWKGDKEGFSNFFTESKKRIKLVTLFYIKSNILQTKGSMDLVG